MVMWSCFLARNFQKQVAVYTLSIFSFLRRQHSKQQEMQIRIAVSSPQHNNNNQQQQQQQQQAAA